MQDIQANLATRKCELAWQQQLEEQESYLASKDADTRAALIQLEAQVINAACDNPGLVVTDQLVLPMVRERLMGKGLAARQTKGGGVAQPSKVRTHVNSQKCHKHFREVDSLSLCVPLPACNVSC